jgi:hypothetical protein
LNKSITNMAASVRQRLLNLARERKEDFGLVLTKYSLQRMLYHIAVSEYRDQFVLKGALLFELWTDERYRPTRDADFLARGKNDPERFLKIFRKICEIKVDDDGLIFKADTVAAEEISEDADYGGIRIKFLGYLEKARVPIQIDLGFGDVITPAPVETKIPQLLDLVTSKLLTYPRETVIAEKFEAMISLGIANSRMKDLYDIQILSREFLFDGAVLSEAIKNTFSRRGTPLPPGIPMVFTAEFFDNSDKKKQWTAFCRRNRNYVAETSLKSVCEEISAFLMPLIQALKGSFAMPGKWSEHEWI